MTTIALPRLRRTTERKDRYVGRHRRGAVELAAPDHGLSPAAFQLVTHTEEQVPAGVDQPTGLLDLREIASTNAWTVPTGTPGDVIAAMLADLADGPAAAVTDIFTATSDTPKDPA